MKSLWSFATEMPEVFSICLLIYNDSVDYDACRSEQADQKV